MNSADTDFRLHNRLETDSLFIADLKLCQLRLINDARFVWVLLIPKRENIKEIYDLSDVDYTRLMEETRSVGKALMDTFQGDKLNIGALGNMVPQLHMHVIVRRKGDAAWPGAVWGNGTAEPYSEDALQEIRRMLTKSLA